MKITEFKKTLRELKLTHVMVAKVIGYSRENITLLLLGDNKTTKIREKHICKEISDFIALRILALPMNAKRKAIKEWFKTLDY